MRLLPTLAVGFLSSLLLFGCGDSEEKPSAESAVSLEGNWVLSITQQFQRGDYRNMATVLLEVKNGKDGYEAKLLGHKSVINRPVLKTFAVEKDRVHLVLTSDRYTYDFVGKADEKLIRGNMDQGGLIIEPAILEKKHIFDISEASDFAFPANFGEYQRLIDKASDEKTGEVSLVDSFEIFNEFCKDHSDSPLALIVYHSVVQRLPDLAKTPAKADAFAKQYLKLAGVWGERMQMFANYNLGRSLAVQPDFSEIGLKYLSTAEKQMDDEKRQEFARSLRGVRYLAERNEKLAEAKAAREQLKEGETEKALATIRKLNEESPYDPVLMYHRAEAARTTNHIDEALKMYGQLTMWPLLQLALQEQDEFLEGDRKLPQGHLLELWNKKHGKTNGLDDYKVDLYKDGLDRITQEAGGPKDPPTGNRVSVMELFTGAGCQPCVGADLATAALEHVYDPEHFFVLRYHVHSAGFDPLTHPRNGDRFQMLFGPDYRGSMGTPSVFLNGTKTSTSVSGFLDNAGDIAKNLQKELQPFLDLKTPLTLKLSGYQHEGEVTVSVNLDGVPDKQREQIRINMFLANKQVKFAARNGILFHEMLVRWFFNDGASYGMPDAGAFQFGEKIRSKEIRDFWQAATDSAAKEFETELDELPLDLDDLQLVVLVQDASTREILQAGTVPVKIYDTAAPSPGKTGPSLTPPSTKLPELKLPE